MSKKQDKAEPVSESSQQTESKPHDASLNIYQRMLSVQKAVKTVQKNETVKMHENDKGYKAVSHDDVAEALHLPLAEAGIFMLPDIEEFSTSSFEKPNSYGKMVSWYRTDIKILVKWINVDKPEEFITAKGAAFALDTSDKSFAKAYSLALKIVLLKVHLLASRDDEEARLFEQINPPSEKPQNGQKQGQNQQKKQGESKQGQAPQGQQSQPKDQQKADNKAKNNTPQSKDYVMPIGGDDVKGKKLGDLTNETLIKVLNHAENSLAKEPEHKGFKVIKAHVDVVLKERQKQAQDQAEQRMSDEGPLFPPDDFQDSPTIDNDSQDSKSKKDDPGEYVISIEFENVDVTTKGKALKNLPEAALRSIQKACDYQLKQTPPAEGVSMTLLFEIKTKIFEFFKTMGLKN